MSKGKFILVNGTFILYEDYRISAEEAESPNFLEQFRVIKTNFPFFTETLEIIKLKLLLFNQNFPEFTDENGAGLRRQMERTLTKNKHFQGAKVTLTFRFSGNKTNYTIQSETIESADYELNDKGLFVEVFDKIQKPASSLSTISLGSLPYWEIAKQHGDESSADEYFILSTSDSILEIPFSNIYLVSENTVLGASSRDGAYTDITKAFVISLFNQLKLEYSEDEEITLESLKNAEEIFVVNAIQGIRWIVGIGGKRYFNKTTKKIHELFKQLVIS